MVLVYTEAMAEETIGWTCQEYLGAEVYLLDEEEEQIIEKRLTNEDDLKPGTVIAAPTLLGGYVKATVASMEDGGLCWKDKYSLGFLTFNEDDRHCWVSGGAINLRGLARLNVEEKP
jgi:hypothetical protein